MNERGRLIMKKIQIGKLTVLLSATVISTGILFLSGCAGQEAPRQASGNTAGSTVAPTKSSTVVPTKTIKPSAIPTHQYSIGSKKVDSSTNKGKAYHKSGKLLYEGKFLEEKFNGKGKLYNENGKLKYEGEFKNGLYNGKGKAYDSKGKVIFEGQFKDGMAILK